MTLRLPPVLVPEARAVPRDGWVSARGLTESGNPWLAAVLWGPLTAQLLAARRYGGLAGVTVGESRAVAVLLPSLAEKRQLDAATLAGFLVVGAPVAVSLAAAFGYLAPLSVVVPVLKFALMPLLVALLLALLGAWLFLRPPDLTAGVVRVGGLAAWPRRGGAGLRTLGQELCDLADTQQVTLDLTARTDDLVGLYTRAGFTQPDPGTRWMIRHPVPQPRRGRPLP